MRPLLASFLLLGAAAVHAFDVSGGRQRRQFTAPVPPLQWIQLSKSTSGPAPPPLRDAVLGVDATSNKLLVFGGRSPGGLYSGTTYILDMDSMTWSNPKSTNPDLQATPKGRAQAVGGPDRGASYRTDFVMFGGQSGDGPLNDVWMYNWENQFWYQPASTNGPSPRYGAVGGTDPLAPSSNDLTTKLYVAGGSDSRQQFPLSDLYEMTISGVLAVNSQDIQISWKKLTTQQQGAVVGQASCVMPGNGLVAAGGCASGASSFNASCATQNAFALATNPLSASWSSSSSSCPAARFAASVAPNLNTASSDFASQVFMMFGAIDRQRWAGDDNADNGEVAVLDAQQGTWTLVIPDGSSRPSGRQGAAAVSRTNVKIDGTEVAAAADTIVFGGVDNDGNFLNDLWVLRAYPGVVTVDNPSRDGVSVKYLTSCAKAITPPPGGPSDPGSPGSDGQPPDNSQPGTGSSRDDVSFDTSTIHKALSPVSVGLLLAAVATYRFISIPTRTQATEQRMGLVYLSWLVGGIAYILGVIGFVVSLATSKRIDRIETIAKRATRDLPFLATMHAKAGFVIFLGLYALVPIAAVVAQCFNRRQDTNDDAESREKVPVQSDKSIDRALSPSPGVGGAAPSAAASEANSNTNTITRLLGGRWRRPRVVSDSEQSSPSLAEPPVRSFEVVRNHRRSDSGGRIPDQSFNSHTRQNPSFSRMLSDINWMERRRSISAVGELDYAMSRMTPEPFPTIVETPSNPQTSPLYRPSPSYPAFTVAIAHLALHAFLLAACVFTLVALHSKAPIAAFAVFLVWCAACYVAIFIAAWRGLPRESVLAVAIYRLRGRHEPRLPERPGASPLQGHRTMPSSGSSRGPYTHHQPAYRLAPSHHDDEELSRHGNTPFPRESESDDDDVDDDERQARLEQEMERRAVTIVSVPKPKLFVTNS
ncbi:hypothetical protein AURDEDRAFT_110461 [Auricularia subglabra TFB-10046 SS5]|nr:hypothetical protein AURDEDRAFT_110461 [Auricularia subglabra TFB-10046 SS5]